MLHRPSSLLEIVLTVTVVWQRLCSGGLTMLTTVVWLLGGGGNACIIAGLVEGGGGNGVYYICVGQSWSAVVNFGRRSVSVVKMDGLVREVDEE
ncbi:hypothetical protein Tco_0995535 [Tanacetum coccineum]